MVVRRIVNDELYHHGIKGQSWGVKNGPPYPLGSDVSTGKRLKKTNSGFIINKVTESIGNNKGYVKNKIELSDKQKKIIKGALIAVGALTLTGAAIYVKNKYNIGHDRNLDLKMNYTTIVDKCKTYRYQQGNFFDPNDGKSLYTGIGLFDGLEYKSHNALTGMEKLGDKKLTFAEKVKELGSSYIMKYEGHNLIVPSIKDSRNIFKDQLNDREIVSDLKRIYNENLNKFIEDKKVFYKNTPANNRRIQYMKQALKYMDNNDYSDDAIKTLYDAWNISITHNQRFNGWPSTNKIFKAFKDKGFSGIWDTHDLYISSMHASNPVIAIDKTKLSLESSRRISAAERLVSGLTIGTPTQILKTIASTSSKYKPKL